MLESIANDFRTCSGNQAIELKFPDVLAGPIGDGCTSLSAPQSNYIEPRVRILISCFFSASRQNEYRSLTDCLKGPETDLAETSRSCPQACRLHVSSYRRPRIHFCNSCAYQNLEQKISLYPSLLAAAVSNVTLSASFDFAQAFYNKSLAPNATVYAEIEGLACNQCYGNFSTNLANALHGKSSCTS